MKKTIFGLADNREHAQRIVDALLATGVSNERVSVLFSDSAKGTTVREGVESSSSTGLHAPYTSDASTNAYTSTKNEGKLAYDKDTKAPEGGATGATAGGIIGGSLGLLAGLGALAIPGLGPFIAAGPIMAALSGSAIGGSLGLIIGYLIGLGIPEYVAKKYESSLKQGNVLLSADADNDQESDRIQDIMKREGAKDVSTSNVKAGARG